MMPCTRGEHHPRQQRHLFRIAVGQQPHQRLVHQRERVHHQQQDVLGKRAVVFHSVFEQRPQQVGVLAGEGEVGFGRPMELAERVTFRNCNQPGGQRLHRLPVYRQDQAVEVAELIIDAADRTIGGFGAITNFK